MEEMLSTLLDGYGGDDVLKFDVFYQIKHAYLPPNAPDKLKATPVVKVSLKNLTTKKILVSYTDANSVRVFLSGGYNPYLHPAEHPDLNGGFWIENHVALKLLFREIPEEEYNRRKQSADFWLLRGDDDVLKLDVFYQIKHAYLPPNAPNKLKATHLVKVTKKNLTTNKILVSYTDVDSVRAFLSGEQEHPDLNEEFVIENHVALKLLFREIPEEEYNRKKQSVDFWLLRGIKL